MQQENPQYECLRQYKYYVHVCMSKYIQYMNTQYIHTTHTCIGIHISLKRESMLEYLVVSSYIPNSSSTFEMNPTNQCCNSVPIKIEIKPCNFKFSISYIKRKIENRQN